MRRTVAAAPSIWNLWHVTSSPTASCGLRVVALGVFEHKVFPLNQGSHSRGQMIRHQMRV